MKVARIAKAIGEPARARMLYCLMDGRARTATELAIVGGVSPSTASVHLNRLKTERLVQILVQGKHRYFSLQSAEVARALEGLSVLAGGSETQFVPNTPSRLRAARTCYDHIAGNLGVQLHDRLQALAWLDREYAVTAKGAREFAVLGIDVEAAKLLRRRFAYACLDWSERRPHIGGALGAAILTMSLGRKWIRPELDSRVLEITIAGRREISNRFGFRPK